MRIFSFIIAAILTVASAFSACAKSDAFTVVIDPGHGGHDSGCVGRVAKEKNIVLDVGKLLRDKIQNKYGKKRECGDDPLNRQIREPPGRADIANKAHGNLFISIHVNSVAKSNKKRRSLKGASTYTVGNHRTQSNLQVAMRENSVMEARARPHGDVQRLRPFCRQNHTSCLSFRRTNFSARASNSRRRCRISWCRRQGAWAKA